MAEGSLFVVADLRKETLTAWAAWKVCCSCKQQVVRESTGDSLAKSHAVSLNLGMLLLGAAAPVCTATSAWKQLRACDCACKL